MTHEYYLKKGKETEKINMFKFLKKVRTERHIWNTQALYDTCRVKVCNYGAL